MRYKLTLLLLTLSSVFYSQGQGWGQGGPNGPPNPPTGYCDKFPNDPICADGVAVPIGSTDVMIIFAFLSAIFFLYKLNGNSLKFWSNGK